MLLCIKNDYWHRSWWRAGEVEGGSGRREHERTNDGMMKWKEMKCWHDFGCADETHLYDIFQQLFFHLSNVNIFYYFFLLLSTWVNFEFFWQICWLPTTQPWWSRWRWRDDAYVRWRIQLIVDVDAHRSRWNDYRTRKRRSTLTCDRHLARFILISKNLKSNSISREIDEPSPNPIRQRRLYGW